LSSLQRRRQRRGRSRNVAQ